MHKPRIRQACSLVGHVSRCLGRSGTAGMSPREFTYVLAGFVLPCKPCAAGTDLRVEGTRGRSERSGEARLRSKMSCPLATMKRQFFGMSKSRRELAVLT